jgi:putative sigma-54 modulation protein
MTTPPRNETEAKLLLGIHVDLSDAARDAIEKKAKRLFRHEPDILRLRIEVERDVSNRSRAFTAKGRIEIAGPDLMASVTSATALVSVTLLIDKLDRMLRKRTSNLLRSRSTDDIRDHPALILTE